MVLMFVCVESSQNFRENVIFFYGLSPVLGTEELRKAFSRACLILSLSLSQHSAVSLKVHYERFIHLNAPAVLLSFQAWLRTYSSRRVPMVYFQVLTFTLALLLFS